MLAGPAADDDEALPSIHDEDVRVAGAMSLDGEGLEPVEDDPLPDDAPSDGDGDDEEEDADEEPTGHEDEDEDDGDEDDAEPEPDDSDEENATRAGRPVKLEIIAGPGKGQRRRFRGIRMIVGRGKGCEVRLKDRSVSRRHVELLQSDAGVLLRDLGSNNGTRVNGEKVSERMLVHLDEIGVGKTTLRFIDELAAVEAARAEAEKALADAKAREEAAAKAIADAESRAAEPEDASAEAPGPGANPFEGDKTQRGVDLPTAADAAPRSTLSRRARLWFRRLPPRKRRLAVGGGLVLVVLLVFGVSRLLRGGPEADPERIQATAQLQAARAAMRAHEYRKALELAEEAERLAPGIDTGKLGEQAREAVATLKKLEEAEGFAASKRYADARRVLQGLPSRDLLPRFDSLKRALEARLDREETTERLQRFEAALTTFDFEAARTVLFQLPAERQAELRERLEELERRRLEALPPVAVTPPGAEGDASPGRPRGPRRPGGAQAGGAAAPTERLERDEQLAIVFAAVERKFANGEWGRAVSECTRVIDEHRGDREIIARAKALQEQIPRFGVAYDNGVARYRQGQLIEAAGDLRAALSLLKAMGLRSNTFMADIPAKLAKAGVAAGREALRRRDVATAAESFRAAAAVSPGDGDARAGLDEVAQQAEELYQAAYLIRDRNPAEAIRRFRIVVDVTPEGSPTHESARKQLSLLAP